VGGLALGKHSATNRTTPSQYVTAITVNFTPVSCQTFQHSCHSCNKKPIIWHGYVDAGVAIGLMHIHEYSALFTCNYMVYSRSTSLCPNSTIGFRLFGRRLASQTCSKPGRKRGFGVWLETSILTLPRKRCNRTTQIDYEVASVQHSWRL